MTDIMAHAVEAIEKKLEGTVFDGSAKFEIEGQGSVIIDASGVRVSDDECRKGRQPARTVSCAVS